MNVTWSLMPISQRGPLVIIIIPMAVESGAFVGSKFIRSCLNLKRRPTNELYISTDTMISTLVHC